MPPKKTITAKKPAARKKKAEAPANPVIAPENEVLVLRTCAVKDGKLIGWGGFPWPESGPVTAPEKWDNSWGPKSDDYIPGFRAEIECGGGLHALEDPFRDDWSLLNWDLEAKALLVSTDSTKLVRVSGKVKFQFGIVKQVGSLFTMLCDLAANAGRINKLVSDISKEANDNASSGDGAKNASSGNHATNASSGYGATNASSGYGAKNASSGNHAKNASSGDGATNASSGDGATNASSGYGATNASSGNHATNASSGDGAKNASSGYGATNASSGYGAKNASSGNHATNASSGDGATNASSGNHATNASSGDGAKNASSGYGATNASSGYGAKNASSGNHATNASSGDGATNEATGKESVLVAAGKDSRVKAADAGAFALTWHDGKRPRIAVGYVGECGIKADTWYCVNKAGQIVEF